jgi:acyl carrier protein
MTIKDETRNYILVTHLHGENPARLGDDDDMIGSGVLDSMALMQLIGHLEQCHGVQVTPDEILIENFGSVNRLVHFIIRKQGQVPIQDLAHGNAAA